MSLEIRPQQKTTAERLLAFSKVGTALMREWDEDRLLHLIARTACELTGANFAAFTLRPLDEEGRPQVPAEGSLFHLAAVVGVTAEQEALFRRLPLGGEGLLAPIFRQGVPVLVADALVHLSHATHAQAFELAEAKEAAQEAARTFAQGQRDAHTLPSLGLPPGHPPVRSFLGAPLLDREGEVRGGLLLGHVHPGQFTEEDQTLLVSLAGQAAVALENARLYRLSQKQAAELQAMFDSIADGVTLVDRQGHVRRENAAARRVLQFVQGTPQAEALLKELISAPVQATLAGSQMPEHVVHVSDDTGEQRDYLITAQPLYSSRYPSGALSQEIKTGSPNDESLLSGAVIIWRDVTERRIREVAQLAQERTNYLEAIFEAMVDGVFVYDQQGGIVQMNAAAHALLASTEPPGAEALPISTRLAEVTVIDTEGRRLTNDQLPIIRTLKEGERFTPEHAVELQMLRHEGGMLYANATGAPIYDASGHIIGAVGVLHDITERKLAERKREELIRQLRLQASLIDLAHDAILVRDRESQILLWNQGAQALYGWAAHEVAGQVTHSLLQTRFPRSQEEVDERLEQEGRWDGELVHTCRDGRQVIVESRQVLLRDEVGAPGAILEINRDISERRRLEAVEREARAEAERRFTLIQLVLDELPSCIYLSRGPEARLVLANRATTTLFGATWAPGQPLQEFLNQNGIRFLGPDGRSLEPEQFPSLRVVQRGEPVRQQQIVIRHADESSLPVLVNAVPLDAKHLPEDSLQATASSGELERAALVVYQDVTALMEAEALKDEFLSIATHELRSPLAVLKGYAEMLLRQAARGRGAPLTAWQQEGLQGITQAASRLGDLTADLLDVTRLQAEKIDQPSEHTDLVALAERVIKRQQVTTQRHHLIFQTSYAHLIANIDLGRMEQVLTNLLSNAIKYSPGGGPIEITLKQDEETGEAVFSIQDHGMGIPREQQAHIFGRFMRADNARASEIVGTGLGLYLCRELIERYGGRIWFESVEGVGSTFFVALPVITMELA